MVMKHQQMHASLIVQFTELRWGVYGFGFSMNFWEWIDDHSHIPRIFEMLKAIDRLLRHPHGRIISKDVSDELIRENVQPSVLLKKWGQTVTGSMICLICNTAIRLQKTSIGITAIGF
jgi:hypothetical protein